MAKQRSVTSQQIREIAAKAFMSTVTVVRVIDGDRRVLEATRLRVREAMRALGINPEVLPAAPNQGQG